MSPKQYKKIDEYVEDGVTVKVYVEIKKGKK